MRLGDGEFDVYQKTIEPSFLFLVPLNLRADDATAHDANINDTFHTTTHPNIYFVCLGDLS